MKSLTFILFTGPSAGTDVWLAVWFTDCCPYVDPLTSELAPVFFSFSQTVSLVPSIHPTSPLLSTTPSPHSHTCCCEQQDSGVCFCASLPAPTTPSLHPSLSFSAPLSGPAGSDCQSSHMKPLLVRNQAVMVNSCFIKEKRKEKKYVHVFSHRRN